MNECLMAVAQDEEFAATMREFFAEVDQAVAARSPICTNRGVCCKFGQHGHRLYVTDVELAYFLRGHGGSWRGPTNEDACPYQVDGLCTAREHRPLGCRIYFCDPASQDWQGPQYERFLSKLKTVGGRHGIGYRYREWLSALRETAREADVKPVPTTLKAVDACSLPVIK